MTVREGAADSVGVVALLSGVVAVVCGLLLLIEAFVKAAAPLVAQAELVDWVHSLSGGGQGTLLLIGGVTLCVFGGICMTKWGK